MFPRCFQYLLCVSALTFVFSGCSKSYPEVSGQITVDGQPVSEVTVMFVPVSTKEDPFPGPYAEGVTDAEGKYSLKTRDGSKGGTPGLNEVEFYVAGEIEVDFMESSALMLLGEAGGDSSHPSYSQGKEMLAKAKSLKAIEGGGKMKPGAKTEFVVPESGTNTANFELSELVSSKTAGGR